MKNVLRTLVIVVSCALTSTVAINVYATESGTVDKLPKSGTNGTDLPCREFPLCSEKFA